MFLYIYFFSLTNIIKARRSLLADFEAEFGHPPKKKSQKKKSIRNKGGRPVGSTNEKKQKQQQFEKDVTHNIICNYVWETKKYGIDSNDEVNKQIFHKILQRAKEHYDLPSTYTLPYSTVLSRVRRGNLNGDGNASPLLAIEPKIVELVICMSKLKRSLNCSEGLRLINELIDGTLIQQKLIEWKKKRKIQSSSPEDLGKVGRKYWQSFMKRNYHVLRNKAGRRYSVNRSDWTAYINFRNMYLHIQDILVNDSKIAHLLPKPVWMNEKGEEVDNEEDALGCKVSIKIDRPDMMIMFDEVGCNLSQEGDNANGGESYLCGVNDQAYQSSATKHNHFTVLGVTSADGNPIMCVVIIKGKKRDVLVESGVDWSLLDTIDDTYIDESSNSAFFEENFGDSKVFPGGPSCTFKGKEVPALIAFTESGGIDGYTLTTIFKRLDALELYKEDREKGLTPFALLDGHQSRFDLDFLRYINDDYTRWNVCIGVPYGTALWQVGDSSEQNGSFKMSLAVEKKELFNHRLDTFQHDLHLVKTDILPLIRKSWRKGFGNVVNNRKAIAHRGWFPFNLVLLLDPNLRDTLTDDLIRWELESGLFPTAVLDECKDMMYVEDENGDVMFKSMVASGVGSESLNFGGGVLAQHVANTVISECDKQAARERVLKRKTEGISRRERIMKIKKKMTAGKLVLEGGSHHLDKNVLEHVQRKRQELEDVALEKRRKDNIEYMKLCFAADKVLASYGDIPVCKWKRRDEIVTVLRPLKRNGDAAMPSSRQGVEKRFQEWKHRSRKDLENMEGLQEEFDAWLNSKKDNVD